MNIDNSLLARVGLSRLRLPVPSVKLAVIHEAAKALRPADTATVTWQALVDQMSRLTLESEVAELLCVAILARDCAVVSPEALRASIARPSILSDALIAQVAGRPSLISSWGKAHSGEVPAFFSPEVALKELTAGRIVPRILATRLRHLENYSGAPLLRQWGYEFTRLLDRQEMQSDGHLGYFEQARGERAVGHFIARRGHIARSAYLRALASAVENWNMPEELANSECGYASPADLFLLQVTPGELPSWAGVVLEAVGPGDQSGWRNLIDRVIGETFEGGKYLMHLNTTLPYKSVYRAEMEVVTVLSSGPSPQADEVFALHDILPGLVEIERTPNSHLILTGNATPRAFPCKDGGYLLPALLPSVTDRVGYLHADLIGRIPYFPVNYSSSLQPTVRPDEGGAVIESSGHAIGELKVWNVEWEPMHDRSLGSRCGVGLILPNESFQQLTTVTGMHVVRAWRARVISREKEYGDWSEQVFRGLVG